MNLVTFASSGFSISLIYTNFTDHLGIFLLVCKGMQKPKQRRLHPVMFVSEYIYLNRNCNEDTYKTLKHSNVLYATYMLHESFHCCR